MHVGPVARPRVRQSPERVSAGPRPHGMGLGGCWPRPHLPGPVSEPQCPRLEVGVEAESLMGCCEAGVRPWGAPERRPFALCHRSLDVWIGFSAVEGAAAGPAPQGGAFSLESCQNWLPGEPHPATAERCVRLGPAGQCNTDLCSAPHSYVCELRPGGARGPGRAGGSACCPGQEAPQAHRVPWSPRSPPPLASTATPGARVSVRHVFAECPLSWTGPARGVAGGGSQGLLLGGSVPGPSTPGPPTLSSRLGPASHCTLAPQAPCGTQRTFSWERPVGTCRVP